MLFGVEKQDKIKNRSICLQTIVRFISELQPFFFIKMNLYTQKQITFQASALLKNIQ
jgi:hypothetical protein